MPNIVTVSEKSVTLSGDLEELKRFRIEIEEALAGDRMELSKRFADLLFNLDAMYQSYHNLDQDDWDIVSS